MSVAKPLRRALAVALIAILFITAPGVVCAAVFYNNDLENTDLGPVDLTKANTLGFVGGYSSGGITVIPQWNVAAADGVGGSKGFSMSANGSGAVNYTAAFGLTLPAIAVNPLGGGTIFSASQIRFSMDIKPMNTIIRGDYNTNGIVEAADYTIWRDRLGSTTDLRADGRHRQ